MIRSLDTHEKIELLVGAACAESSRFEPTMPSVSDLPGEVFQAKARCRNVPLLKVLLSNSCQNDCAYCGTRASAPVRRCTLSPDEMARSFDLMRRSGLVEGLFISSGLCGDAVRAQDRLIDTVEIVRNRYEFRGYVHLKVMPGATADQVERAGMIADRVSVNLESPNSQRLSVIAPDKRFDGLLNLVGRIGKLQSRWDGYAPAGPTTQFVAGAAGESDQEILSCSDLLYRRHGLRRVYYSGFHPLIGSPLEDVPPMSPAREHRLYQADALLRQYGFGAEEMPFDEAGDLDGRADPKLAWALRHPERFPVEVNSADRNTLIRVPGIGPIGARRVIQARRQVRLRELGQLAALGVRTATCAPFVLLAGHRPAMQPRLPMMW